MTPPWAFADVMGLARRRAVGAGHARPGGFPGDERRQDAAGEGLAVGEGFIPPGMFAAAGGFRGVGDAAPYVGGRPLTGGCANLRRGVVTPPYGWSSGKRCGGGIYAARAGGFPGDGRRREVSGASGTPPPTWGAAR